MAIDWNKIFSAVLQVEETALPVFVHNPQSGNIAGVVLVAESILAPVIAEALGGKTTTVTVPDSPAPVVNVPLPAIAPPLLTNADTTTVSVATQTISVPVVTSPVILGRKAVMVRGGAD